MLNAADDVVVSVDAQELEAQSTRPIPETVRKAMTFTKNAKMPSGNLPYLASSHSRLVEACQIHATWANMLVVFEDDTPIMDYTPQYIS
jgi:hypothetical protein